MTINRDDEDAYINPEEHDCDPNTVEDTLNHRFDEEGNTPPPEEDE